MRNYVTAAALVLGTFTLAGCPEIQPPFDASGNYAGAFTVGLGDLEMIDGCGILLALNQDVGGLPIANGKVEGTVTLSFACVLPEDLALLASGSEGDVGAALAALGAGGLMGSMAGDMAGMLNIPAVEVSGVLLPDGTLELNTPGILDDCTEANCVKLAMVGKGVDLNGDGAMDFFDGTFGGTLGSNLGDLPIIGEFEASALD